MNAIVPASLPSPTLAPLDNWRDGLTVNMAEFVEHYCRWRNATQAYTAAYDTQGNYETRRNEGHRLLRDPRIKAGIAARQRIATEASGLDVGWLLQRFADIATADPRELIGLKIGCCRYCWGERHGYQWREREYLEQLDEAERLQAEAVGAGRNPNAIRYPDPAGGFDFNATRPPHPNCPQCHGEGVERVVPRDTDNLSDEALLLFGGVKRKADGSLEIIVADRVKAAELAGRVMGAFTENVSVGGTIKHLHAVADLRNMPPQDAARAYRDFVAGSLSIG